MAVIAIVLMLKYAQAMVIPVVLGLLMSYALDPLVTGLTKLRIPRALGAAVVLLTLVGVGGLLLYQLRDQVDAIAQQLPDGARRLRRALERGNADGAQTSTIAQVQKAATELERAADAASSSPPARPGVTRVQVEQPPVNVSAYVMWGSLSLAAAAVQVLLVLFLAYFLLASGDLHKRKLVKIVGPSLSRKKITVQILEDIDHDCSVPVRAGGDERGGRHRDVAGHSWIGLEQAAVWGPARRRLQHHSVARGRHRHRDAAVVAFLQFGTIEMALLASAAAFAITTIEGSASHRGSSRAADERRRRFCRSSFGAGSGNLGDAARGCRC
jgi:predicted PurR-regulated permease PerM